ncbi:MAG: hypothetical protein ABR958_00370 [Dehalococcoidales bacterium]
MPLSSGMSTGVSPGWGRFPRVGIIASWIAVIGYAVIVAWNASLILLA